MTPEPTPEPGARAGGGSHLLPVLRALRDLPLDADGVAATILDATAELGFDGAALIALTEDGAGRRAVASSGSALEGLDPAVDAVLASGASATVGRLVAAPVWVDGWLAGVLAGRGTAAPDPSAVEAFELLAVSAGNGLQNAERFEAERRSVERLEEVDRLKRDFLTTISHELRTPLTVIEGTGLTLERSWDELDDDTRRGFVATVNARARVLAEIVDALLDVANLDEAAAPADDVFALRPVVAGAVERQCAALEGHPVAIDVAPTTRVRSDEALVGRVLDHLLSNAKHTPAGTSIALGVERSGDRVVVSVRDDGPGIPEAELSHLGERFFRGGDQNVRPAGVGLGLFLVTDLLDLLGSRLDVRSSATATVFAFPLPAADR